MAGEEANFGNIKTSLTESTLSHHFITSVDKVPSRENIAACVADQHQVVNDNSSNSSARVTEQHFNHTSQVTGAAAAAMKDITNFLSAVEIRECSQVDKQKKNEQEPLVVSCAPFPKDLYMDRYSMDYPRRGSALIINNDKFDVKGCSERKGSEKDVMALKRVLGDKLGFEVVVRNNLTVYRMKKAIKEIAALDHTDADCFMCVVLTHGKDDDYIYGTDGVTHHNDLSRLVAPDRCESLVGKPKIFMYQACRGERFDIGVDLVQADGRDNGLERIPLAHDFLHVFSTGAGCFSWSSTDGSWFIQTLCRMIEMYHNDPDKDFCRILTSTNANVGLHKESVSKKPGKHGKKQSLVQSSTLSKLLFFKTKTRKNNTGDQLTA